MEKIQFRLWEILLLPVALPMKSIGITIRYLQEEVEKETSDMAPWHAFLEQEIMKELGDSADEDGDELEV